MSLFDCYLSRWRLHCDAFFTLYLVTVDKFWPANCYYTSCIQSSSSVFLFFLFFFLREWGLHSIFCLSLGSIFQKFMYFIVYFTRVWVKWTRSYSWYAKHYADKQNKVCMNILFWLFFIVHLLCVCYLIYILKKLCFCRRGLITRNVKAAVDIFHERFGVIHYVL